MNHFLALASGRIERQGAPGRAGDEDLPPLTGRLVKHTPCAAEDTDDRLVASGALDSATVLTPPTVVELVENLTY